MRLWHYKLIPFLPNSQLLAQWRELNCIFKKEPNHILINYIYGYDLNSCKDDLWEYTEIVINELRKRGFKLDLKNKYNYLGHGRRDMVDYNLIPGFKLEPFKKHHNNRYLRQCFYNLQEKYDRGQKDFSKEQYEKLLTFISEEGEI